MRIKAVRKIISDGKCTHVLVNNIVDVEYISGFRSSNATLLISADKLTLYTDFRYRNAAEEFCRANTKWNFHLIEESNFKYLAKSTAPSSIVGIQSDTVTIDQLHELKRSLPKTKFAPLSNEIANISIQKNDKEIASMKAAAATGDKALKALLPNIRTGMTEIELARQLEALCAEYGSQRPSFETIALFGERSALPHGRPGSRKLAPGDFILLDYGCTVDGFCSDISRTFVFGEASQEQRKIYNIVLKAQTCARSAARSKIKACELDFAARNVIEQSGYGENFGHATGHGVGLRVHEKPRVNKKNEALLPENCVITIEPGIYISGLGGVRIEDMVVLTGEGCSTLTNSPRKLIELPI
ncbi:MAG: aminopeptidase P family protein [Chitinispirillales bacterium]|jgi:Xaa-Pro aminopeptidase|nr:aminopeptidase P family protein [Chitinispirillales bacterium]